MFLFQLKTVLLHSTYYQSLLNYCLINLNYYNDLTFYDWVYLQNSTYYRKNKSSNIVTIKATIDLSGSIIPADGFNLCTIPEEIRPKYNVTFAVTIMGASNTYYPGTIVIYTNGITMLYRGSYSDSVWTVMLYGEYYIE